MGDASTDWQIWHEDYRDPASDLSRRLEAVREEIRAAVGSDPPDGYRIVALCAGQGDDLLGALAHHPLVARIHARLVELDPGNVSVLSERLAAAGLGWEVVASDAGDPRNLAGAIPADLVLVCGVFGNISDHDVFATIAALPGLCRPGASVIWTRHRRPPNLVPRVRAALADAGFAERAFVAPSDARWSVGRGALSAAATASPPGQRMFAFISPAGRPDPEPGP